MTDWYSSDPHFFQRTMAPPVNYCNRPWASVEEMDDGLVANYNSVVGPMDTLWLVGDIAIRREGLKHVSRINGRKILVAGNHDFCWEGHSKQGRARNAIKWYLDAGFDEVHTGPVKHVIGGHEVLISHLPYATPHGSGGEEEGWVDKYATRRPVDEGLPLICGHVHEHWRIHPTHGRMWNVGVDANGWMPVHEDAIAEWIGSL